MLMVVSLQGNCFQFRFWLLYSQSVCGKGYNLFIVFQRLLLGKSLKICPTQYLPAFQRPVLSSEIQFPIDESSGSARAFASVRDTRSDTSSTKPKVVA